MNVNPLNNPNGLPDLRPGYLLDGRWKLLSPVTWSERSYLWRALDLRENRYVVAKVFPRFWGKDSANNREFLRAANAAAKLHGESLLDILDIGLDIRTETPFVTMEFLEGEDLEARLKRGPLGYWHTLAILSGICLALDQAHGVGLLHRQLVPSKIFLVDTEGAFWVKVLDFLFGNLSFSYERRGTPEYMVPFVSPEYSSPESIMNPASVDERSDLWSVGVIAYRCITGRLPIQGDSPIDFVRRVYAQQPMLPVSGQVAFPRSIDSWFAKALARDPADRFSSALELLDAFRQLGVGLDPPQRYSKAKLVLELVDDVKLDEVANFVDILKSSFESVAGLELSVESSSEG